MGMTPIFNEKLEKITLRFPLDVNQWVNDRGDISTVVRKIIDSKYKKHKKKRDTRAYKQPNRSHRGKPRKDESPFPNEKKKKKREG